MLHSWTSLLQIFLLLNLFFCQFVEVQAAQKDELPPKPELYFSLFILFVFGKYLYRDSF